MKQRNIGDDPVGQIGLGCMGMSHAYGSSDEKENLKVLRYALESGCNFWDTADFYGAGTNEALLGRVLKGNRDKVFLSTKVGNVFDRTLTSHQSKVRDNVEWIVDGSPAYIRKSIDNSLNRLGVDYVDLYYLHRVDPHVPIEESVGALAELVRKGKVRYLGLSEASADSIRRAARTHPITALQSEYSLWTRGIEDEIVPACRELGISIVPFAPLGRGYLTGKITKSDDLEDNDWRRSFPRFKDGNMQQNAHIITTLTEVASNHQSTPAQIALAWVLARGPGYIPIPGTRHVRYLQENMDASGITLEKNELAALDGIGARTVGERFPSIMDRLVDK